MILSVFGKKKSAPQTQNEVMEEENRVNIIEPYQDELESWKDLNDDERIKKWYNLSLTQYEEADSPAPDESGAEWYLDAAKNGNPCAQYVLGKMYYQGTVKSANVFQSAIWYSRASDKGNPFASYEFAKMCAFGIGMDADKQTADNLYQTAYAAFQAIESKKPNQAVELLLAVMCENNLVDAAECEHAGHWRTLLNSHHIQAPAKLSLEVLPTNLPDDNSEANSPTISSSKVKTLQKSGKAQDVPTEFISLAADNPYSENDTDEAIFNLAMSIEANGLINPITLNKLSDTEYQIIAGEKRYMAITRYLHWDTIPSRVHEHLTPNAAQLMLHTANLDVREYTSGQKMQSYIDVERLLCKMKESGEYTGPMQKGISELLGISTHQIRKYKKIIETLPDEQLQKVMNGKLSIEKAYKTSLMVEKADVLQESEDGRTSAPVDEDNRIMEFGRASVLEDEENTAIELDTGRASTPADDDKTVAETGRASAFKNPTNFEEALELLQAMLVSPGQECAVIDRSGNVDFGNIDRLELYQDALVISVIVKDIRYPYPVSKIGTDLFIGEDCRELAAKCN